MVVKVYYLRSKYPYKVIHVDYNSGTVLQTDLHTNQADWKPMGSVVYITPLSSITNDGVTYLPITDTPQPLTIFYEDDDHLADPQTNVKTIYYRKQDSVQLNYEIICEGAVEGDLQLSQNREIVKLQTDIKGCTATDYSGVDGRYTFLGWYQTPSATEYDALTTDYKYVPPLPLNDVTYYAIFQMNSAPYTLNYVYQGRKGGNDGSYIGDDAETDEKVYTVTLELKPEDLDENGMPLPKHLVDNAPAVEDLYKKCVWTIDDEHVVFDGKTRTATITADQRAMRYSVKFYYNNDIYDVQRVQLNTQVRPNGSYVVAPQTDAEGQPFAYWLVEENGREVAKCFNKAFDLRVTGDINVTACYGETAKSVTISNAEYSRQQYTDAKTGKQVDKLYADFIVAYMDDQGTMLNPEYSSDPETSRQYKSGVIVQYSQNQTLTKPNAPGAKLSEDDKKVFPEGDVLTKENAKKLAKGNSLDTGYTYYVSDIANGKYNNRNRLDKALSFNNSETARRLVLCAYYYVWNTKTDEFEMSEPVYFYLYDIGNSVTENKEN